MSDHIVPDELEPGDFWLSTDLDSWGNFHITELMDMESDICEVQGKKTRGKEFDRLRKLEAGIATRLNCSYELAWGLPLNAHEPIVALLQELLEYVELDIQGTEFDKEINALANKIRTYLGIPEVTLEDDSDAV